MVNLIADDTLQMADWLRGRWHLPPYRSKEFMQHLKDVGMTLGDFQKLSIYKAAVKSKLIIKDKWVSPVNSKV